MTLATADFKIPGTITGTGRVAHRRSHDRQHARDVPLPARGREDVGGGAGVRGRRPQVRAGRVRRSPTPNRAALEPSIKELGLSAWAVDAAPTVPMHDLDVPRIGYIHTWTSTQDEGWVRLALDNFKVPYTYFGATTSCGRATCARSTTSSSFRTPGRAGPRLVTAACRATSRGRTRRPTRRRNSAPGLDRRHARRPRLSTA